MYREGASFPGHRLLALTCVSTESWWTAGHVRSAGNGCHEGGMDGTGCTGAESRPGCFRSVEKMEWAYKVC